MDVGKQLGPLSRVLHVVGEVTSRARAAAFVTVLVIAVLALLAWNGFPDEWQYRFQTMAAAVTTIMVFVIQHTQSRQQTATQLKLDELIKASPQADDLLVHIEAAADEELVEHERKVRDHHSSVRSP